MDTTRILIYGERLGALVDVLAYLDHRLQDTGDPGSADPPDVEPLLRAMERAEPDVVLDRAWVGLPPHSESEPSFLFSEVLTCIRNAIDAVRLEPLHLQTYPRWRRTPAPPDGSYRWHGEAGEAGDLVSTWDLPGRPEEVR